MVEPKGEIPRYGARCGLQQGERMRAAMQPESKGARTWNVIHNVVTEDVSQESSGWSKALAPCQ